MEIDAEEYGVLAACEYLKENFPNNNYEELILDYVNSRSDASEYYFFTLFENDKLTKINDIPKIYDNAFAESKNKAKTYFTSKYDSKHSLRCLLDKKLI